MVENTIDVFQQKLVHGSTTPWTEYQTVWQQSSRKGIISEHETHAVVVFKEWICTKTVAIGIGGGDFV